MLRFVRFVASIWDLHFGKACLSRSRTYTNGPDIEFRVTPVVLPGVVT
jgi:hypothetical protein